MRDHNAVTVPLKTKEGPPTFFWKCSCGASSGRGWPKHEAERQRRLHATHENRRARR